MPGGSVFKRAIILGAAITAVSFIGLVPGLGVSRVAASQTPIVITIPAKKIVHHPPVKNVYPLIQKDVANGKYHISIEVKNTKQYTGNTIFVIAGPHHMTAGASAQQVVFSDVGAKVAYRKTASQTLVVGRGKVLVSVAVGTKLSGDKTFDGSVKLTLTPADAQVQTAASQQPTQKPAGQVLAAATLPKTGPEGILILFVGATGLGYIVHRRLRLPGDTR